DRGRVRVDEDDPIAFRTQSLAGLRSGIVEFARLADDDRPGADDENGRDVGALRHGSSGLTPPDGRDAGSNTQKRPRRNRDASSKVSRGAWGLRPRPSAAAAVVGRGFRLPYPKIRSRGRAPQGPRFGALR